MRGRFAALAVTLAVVAGSGAAYVVVHRHPRPVAPGRRTASSAAPVPSRAPVLMPVSTTGPAPTPAGIARRLRAAAAAPALGGGLTGLVVDASTGTRLFARRPDAASAPASTAKLLTAVAALRTFGADARLTTSVVRAGNTLYLVGGGDVTLAAARRSVYPSPATLPMLAARTAGALETSRFRLRYDDSRWRGPATAPGWSPSYVTGGDVSPVSALEVDEGRLTGFTSVHPQPRTADPAQAAASAFAKDLVVAGVRLRGGAPERSRAPAGATTVAAVLSPPVGALVQRMLTASDNDLAEALARAVAAKTGQPASFAGAAKAVMAALRAAQLPTAGLVLHDGSGLSRLDRATPRLLVAILNDVVTHQELSPITAGLPVAGLTGTLADRYRGATARAGAGVVRAKTGTLAGVNTLAGTVVDADGRLLVFAFMTDRAVDPDLTEPALDRLAARLAGCGCP